MLESDWAEVGEQLMAYAVWLVRNRRWGHTGWDDIGQGLSAEDVVREVIFDAVAGRTGFDPERGALLPYLKQRIRWRLSNLGKSAPARQELLSRDERSPEAVLSGWEEKAVAREFLARLRQRVDEHMASRKRNIDLPALLDAIIDGGHTDGQVLADLLGITRDQVYYQLRVLRKLAQEVAGETNHEPV